MYARKPSKHRASKSYEFKVVLKKIDFYLFATHVSCFLVLDLYVSTMPPRSVLVLC